MAAPNLTSAAFLPAWAQFANIFGRYVTMQAALVIMIVGSALCAGAPTSSFPMLLAGRGIQGVGIAGSLILVRIILADKVTLHENSKNNSYFTLVMAIGFSIGPVIGGFLTSASWRWCFIINIPLCVAGMLLMHFVTRKELLGPQDIARDDNTPLSRSDRLVKRLSSVDFGGLLLFILGLGLFVLALTWAGAYYPWSAVHVLAPLIIGVVLLVLFFVWEFLLLPGRWLAEKFPHQQPMLPLQLVWTRNAGILSYINFITGMGKHLTSFAVFGLSS